MSDDALPLLPLQSESAKRQPLTWEEMFEGEKTVGFQAHMSELVARPLCDRVGRGLRFEMRLTWLGGSGILDRIEHAGYDVFRRRPSHGLLDKAGLAWRAWRWKQ